MANYNTSSTNGTVSRGGRESFFPIPPFIRKIFDSFPLKIYPPNPLPSACPRPSSTPSLYIFSTVEDAVSGKPSFNPGCLKWQTYLKLCGVNFRTVASNNHASPSGALPFLIPATAIASSSDAVVSAPPPVQIGKLPQWARENGTQLTGEGCDLDASNVRAFLTLVDTRVRDAWMYAIYLEPSNFEMLTKHMYCATSAPLVNSLLSTGFQQQAAKELQKYWNSIIVSADDVYADAEAAFASLDCILGTNDWFFNASSPGLFDATLFGYTHLILTMRWHEKEATLERMVRKHRNLVEHEMRLRKHCGW